MATVRKHILIGAAVLGVAGILTGLAALDRQRAGTAAAPAVQTSTYGKLAGSQCWWAPAACWAVAARWAEAGAAATPLAVAGDEPSAPAGLAGS